MTQQRKELMWTWILRFVNLVRVFAGVVLAMAIVTHFEWFRAFLNSDPAGGFKTVLFAAAVTFPLITMFLWFRNYKHTAHMIREQDLNESKLTKISYNLFAIYALEIAEGLARYYAPQFSWTRTSTVNLPDQVSSIATTIGDMPPGTTVSTPNLTMDMTAQIPFLTPVTEGMATLVLACVILYWAKSLSENKALKSELSEIV